MTSEAQKIDPQRSTRVAHTPTGYTHLSTHYRSNGTSPPTQNPTFRRHHKTLPSNSLQKLSDLYLPNLDEIFSCSFRLASSTFPFKPKTSYACYKL